MKSVDVFKSLQEAADKELNLVSPLRNIVPDNPRVGDIVILRGKRFLLK